MEERNGKETVQDLKTAKKAFLRVPTNGLSTVIIYLNKVVDPLSNFGLVIACVTLAAMMFLTFFDVAGRYIFNKPIIGSYEITEFMMAILVGFALAYCGLKKGHIRVDLILQHLSRKANLWFDIFTYGFSCIFYVFIVWQTFLKAWENVSSHLASSVLLIPVYPFVFIFVIGAAFVTLVFLRNFLQSIAEVIK